MDLAGSHLRAPQGEGGAPSFSEMPVIIAPGAEGFAFINRIGQHGIEVVMSNGSHFCIPMAVWDRLFQEAWNEECGEKFDRHILYGEPE